MDGVLIQSEKFYSSRRKKFFEMKNIPYNSKLNLVGSNEKEVWEKLVPENDLLREKLKLEYRLYRTKNPVPFEHLVTEGALSIFKELNKRGLKLAIASSSNKNSIEKVIEVIKIREYIDYYISGEECEEHKPNPEIYLKVLEKLEIDAESAIVIEDSQVGIDAAKKANIKVYAYYQKELDQKDADLLIYKLNDILTYI